MLAPYPIIRRALRLAPRRSRAPLRIYSPPHSPPATPNPTSAEAPPRCGEPWAIGELMPLVLARYLTTDETN